MPTQSEGIWIIDASARTLYANAAMADILGTIPADLIGQPSFEYVFPEDARGAKAFREQTARRCLAISL
jgi:PAS domain S-box-containing protein